MLLRLVSITRSRLKQQPRQPASAGRFKDAFEDNEGFARTKNKTSEMRSFECYDRLQT